MLRKDLWIAPLCEGTLILVVSLAAWVSHQPLIFASLGPTAFELIEAPKRPSARAYNIIVGHLIAVVVGLGVVYATHAWRVPVVSAGHVSLLRVIAAVVAAMVTVFVTLLARATQPAAIATALLVSLGFMQTLQDGVVIMVAVLLMTAVGEPFRRWRAKHARSLESNLEDSQSAAAN